MKLIDLSRELYHRTPAHPSHPPVALATWYDHDEVKTAGNTRFSSKALFLSMSDHAGTHVDAPCHFNPDPRRPPSIRCRWRISSRRRSASISVMCR